jgi:ribosomal protein S18 acetylase RimI-like enzyme
MTCREHDVLRMRVELVATSLRAPSWPDGVRARTFTPHDAPALHGLLLDGYRRGGGDVAPYDEWASDTTGDEEFDGALCFLAECERGLAGAALCWTSAFVKDLVVDESWRRRGLGEALLLQALAVFAARGARAVELKVQSTNSGALRLYERLGFRVTERLRPFPG